ncbi:sigma-54 interaction domain-containing protein [Fusobacterium ulcerans]|uniref:Sigma-54 factor interaction domain-containing protein n=1 Tax=Fusobacterium ulcerans 12-1B TaxID=457404 RepID=H1PW17_9FUSO|nr:sigma 54-interacting transcriptional regulator [Fusobacterium ulcerans]EHO79871.1 hypothetical protein HMPREF0402_02610 [Fusobacterium ulcerans 12-1B]
MEGILQQMQGIAQKYVDILSEILKIDVTIIDIRQIRIAGSGRMQERLGDMSSYGYIVKTCLESKKRIVLTNPEDSEICFSCPKKATCDNKSEVWQPLILDDKVIGALGFVCFNQKQKNHFEKNYNLFLKFLEQFSDLIVSKARDVIEFNRNKDVLLLFENVIDRVEMGMIVLNKEEEAVKINQLARKILHINEAGKKLPDILFSETGKKVLDLKEYQIQIENITYTAIGKFYDVELEDYKKVFLFQNAVYDEENILGINNSLQKRDIDKILGVSSKIMSIKEKIQIIAPSASSVFITGESGTGKELVATALHSESERKNFPFIAFNCASIPENLLESELFGYVKGAFTGADNKGRIGIFEAANGGTLFLDEVGDMPSYLQVKLLRVLERKEITRLGSNQVIKIDVRLIAATNKNMEELVTKGEFREDLYYRLNVIPIKLPPLRERKEDIKILAKNFIDKYSSILNKTVSGIDQNFWRKMEEYSWPGNVRELQNSMEYVVNMMKYTEVINFRLLPHKVLGKHITVDEEENFNLEHMEKRMIEKLLNIYGYSPEAKQEIAKKLGIGIATLYRKIKVYEL